MTKTEFIAWLEGYKVGVEGTGYKPSEIVEVIILKAEEIYEPIVQLPPLNTLTDLIGEFTSKLPDPNDWSVDLKDWPDWSINTPSTTNKNE